MPKRSRKKKNKDLNELAHSIIGQVEYTPPKTHEKNPAAVALGRLGGLKGGKARSERLSPERRKEIARKAASSRWNNKRKLKA